MIEDIVIRPDWASIELLNCGRLSISRCSSLIERREFEETFLNQSLVDLECLNSPKLFDEKRSKTSNSLKRNFERGYTAISTKVVGKNKLQSALHKTERWSGYSLEFCI